MVIQFTLQELMIFLVCALAIAAGVLLIPILWNIKKVVGIVRPLVESNQAAYKKSFATIPGIVEDIAQISGDVKETTGKLKLSVPVILNNVQSASGTAKGSIESAGVIVGNIGSSLDGVFAPNRNDTTESTSGFMAYLPIIKDVLQLILRAFAPGK
jgi:hypothetical protein